MQTKELSLYHLIRPAKEQSNQSAVLIMLHGYGSNEADLFSFASELPEELCILSLRAPHSLMDNAYAWYAIHFDEQQGKWTDTKQAIASVQQIKTFIEEAIQAYDLNAQNIQLMGFSQGAILSYALALQYPNLIQNIIALSGYIEESIIEERPEKEAFKHLSVYASHGTVDQVIPVEWARKTQKYLEQLAIDYTYEEFPVGHGVAPQNFFSFKKWLEAHL